MAYFIFLEFLDRKVESTLRDLRDALQPSKRSHSPVHVTLRGPYKAEPDLSYMGQLSRNLQGSFVQIIGAGLFSTEKGYAVFLRAESPAFRKIWWKPDYKTSSGEIQPHLTLYESEDRESALLAFNFLRASRISILACSLQLSVYDTKQKNLFGTYPVHLPPLNNNEAFQRDVVAIDPETLPAARDLGLRLMDIASKE